MGAAAIPVMIAMTAVSTAATLYTTQQQSDAQEADVRSRGRQAATQAREQEIDRLALFRQVAAENTARMAAGGFAVEGTLAQIREGNLATLEDDITGIKTSGAVQQQYFGRAIDNVQSAGAMSSFSALLQGAASMSNVVQTGANVQTPSPTGTITGVS